MRPRQGEMLRRVVQLRAAMRMRLKTRGQYPHVRDTRIAPDVPYIAEGELCLAHQGP